MSNTFYLVILLLGFLAVSAYASYSMGYDVARFESEEIIMNEFDCNQVIIERLVWDGYTSYFTSCHNPHMPIVRSDIDER